MLDEIVEFKLAKEENRMNGMKTGAPENHSTENNRYRSGFAEQDDTSSVEFLLRGRANEDAQDETYQQSHIQ
ncbi:hypothetical protein CFAM422_007530 [Trichoderma lentiforme]|uniref:Uncharacterized protein n=1 Tax=Trichoderma lentiforme TaxID=1567552 RepID=A0A9P5CDC6_9HYPO|nr:hypothetical protein CFAM422_007530 [Trichoderma lentiforme]